MSNGPNTSNPLGSVNLSFPSGTLPNDLFVFGFGINGDLATLTLADFFMGVAQTANSRINTSTANGNDARLQVYDAVATQATNDGGSPRGTTNTSTTNTPSGPVVGVRLRVA